MSNVGIHPYYHLLRKLEFDQKLAQSSIEVSIIHLDVSHLTFLVI